MHSIKSSCVLYVATILFSVMYMHVNDEDCLPLICKWHWVTFDLIYPCVPWCLDVYFYPFHGSTITYKWCNPSTLAKFRFMYSKRYFCGYFIKGLLSYRFLSLLSLTTLLHQICRQTSSSSPGLLSSFSLFLLLPSPPSLTIFFELFNLLFLLIASPPSLRPFFRAIQPTRVCS